MFLKTCLSALIPILLIYPVLSQETPVSENDSLLVKERINFVKANLEMEEFDEEKFLNIYNEYVSEQKRSIKCSFLTLSNLARIASGEESQEVFDCLNSLLVFREDELNLKHKYFTRIAKDINGLAGLQFLQIEEMLRLLRLSQQYESDGFAAAKAGDIVKELKAVKVKYEWESAELFGENLSSFEPCFAHTSTLTPRQAIQIGEEFINLERRQARLNRKYADDINKSMGGSFAGAFFMQNDLKTVTKKIEVLSNSDLLRP